MADNTTAAPDACSHGCSSCSSDSCGPDKKKGLSFFGTLGAISEHTDKLSDEELMKMLQDAVEEWEEQ